ncbi:MAG: NAD(P)H-dependent oxidoreductase subunit E, partial [Planctomycetota bacterium]|nr:NAD(P)H-dependent oxidoreductase subunit E [Planctomycetota bacterium]
MTNPSDKELIEQWRDEPAPLLPLLHAFHDRDGYLSEDSLEAVSSGLRIPMAELFGTVTFYHHFSREPGGKECPRVCTGNVCSLHGANELVGSLSGDGAQAMPCAGRCDEFIPVIRGDKVWVGTEAGDLENRPSPLPPVNPGGIEECVFASIREPGRSTLSGYTASGGYAGIEKLLSDASPEAVVQLIADSRLAGRGGAGFPTGTKWKAVAEAPGDPKTIVCNADEGEPGCFKDRAIMDHDPHAVIEGMIIAG